MKRIFFLASLSMVISITGCVTCLVTGNDVSADANGASATVCLTCKAAKDNQSLQNYKPTKKFHIPMRLH